VARAERAQATGRTSGIWTPLTSFMGRAGDVTELTRLVEKHRLVTVTGPGGVGKTRLAIEVARGLEDRFPDGVWFVGLATVADEVQVATEVTSALGVAQDPGRPPVEVLAGVLAPRRQLIILDNCEHVLPAVADLCGVLLRAADEVCVLATSREQIGLGAEARYRLTPLELPGSAEPAAVANSAASALFIERARQTDPRFTLSPESALLVARVVAQLDGMPLAIELAAARAEALGMAGLAERIDDALRLLTSKDLLAANRHRSLAALTEWSYELLAEPEQRVFRRLAAFPGPFTLDAAEAVAGPNAAPIAPRLVDCSLLLPPQTGADGRTRYRMLQILRAYAMTRLREAGEEHQTTAALTAFARSVAEQAAAGLDTSEHERAALRWLDAEDATLSHSLNWAMDHDPDSALRLGAAVAPWLRLRGRLTEAHRWLTAAIAVSAETGQDWARAQFWLGHLSSDGDEADPADHFTAAIDAYRGGKASAEVVRALASGRAIARLNRDDLPGAVGDARRALTLARELGDPASEVIALTGLGAATCYGGDTAEALDCIQQARELLRLDIPGWVSRWCHYVLALVLTENGEIDAARSLCAAGLKLARQVDDLVVLGPLLGVMGDLDRLAGNLADAGTHLREAVTIASRTGNSTSVTNLIEQCGYLCADAGRWADASTLWAAVDADRKRRGRTGGPVNADLHEKYVRQAERMLAPHQLREATERGARMPVPAATEVAMMATTAAQELSPQPDPGKPLSARERELVALVALGNTNAEIAARLHISVRTVTSHLDRIRDKTGYRRRADLTRLAVEESLV
jgi:predicted ATPase/DNA-binding CsgD family transcriptional regulator